MGESDWYFIPGMESRIEMLTENGIPAAAVQSTLRGGTTGIAFPPEFRAKVVELCSIVERYISNEVPAGSGLTALVSEAVATEERERLDRELKASLEAATARPTRKTKISRPTLATEEGTGTGQVIVENTSNMESRIEIEEVLKELGAKYHVDFLTRNLHGMYDWDGNEPQPGTRRVLFWASADNTTSPTARFERAYGHRFEEDGSGDSCCPSENADFYIPTPEGRDIGEVVGRTIFLYSDIPMGNNAAPITRAALETYFKICNGEQEMAKRNPEEVEEELAKGLQAALQRIGMSQINMIESTIADHKANITRLQRDIHNYLAALIKSQLQLEKLKAPSVGELDKVKREIQAIRKLEMVESMTILSSAIQIKTKHIDFVADGIERLGHKYNIIIDVVKGSIVVKSADRLPKRRDLIHPHVNSTGHPCWGNIGGGVMSLLIERQFAALIQLIIEYLGTANKGDWYADAAHWPTTASIREAEEAAKRRLSGEKAEKVPEAEAAS